MEMLVDHSNHYTICMCIKTSHSTPYMYIIFILGKKRTSKCASLHVLEKSLLQPHIPPSSLVTSGSPSQLLLPHFKEGCASLLRSLPWWLGLRALCLEWWHQSHMEKEQGGLQRKGSWARATVHHTWGVFPCVCLLPLLPLPSAASRSRRLFCGLSAHLSSLPHPSGVCCLESWVQIHKPLRNTRHISTERELKEDPSNLGLLRDHF